MQELLPAEVMLKSGSLLLLHVKSSSEEGVLGASKARKLAAVACARNYADGMHTSAYFPRLALSYNHSSQPVSEQCTNIVTDHQIEQDHIVQIRDAF